MSRFFVAPYQWGKEEGGDKKGVEGEEQGVVREVEEQEEKKEL